MEAKWAGRTEPGSDFAKDGALPIEANQASAPLDQLVESRYGETKDAEAHLLQDNDVVSITDRVPERPAQPTDSVVAAEPELIWQRGVPVHAEQAVPDERLAGHQPPTDVVTEAERTLESLPASRKSQETVEAVEQSALEHEQLARRAVDDAFGSLPLPADSGEASVFRGKVARSEAIDVRSLGEAEDYA